MVRRTSPKISLRMLAFILHRRCISPLPPYYLSFFIFSLDAYCKLLYSPCIFSDRFNSFVSHSHTLGLSDAVVRYGFIAKHECNGQGWFLSTSLFTLMCVASLVVTTVPRVLT